MLGGVLKFMLFADMMDLCDRTLPALVGGEGDVICFVLKIGDLSGRLLVAGNLLIFTFDLSFDNKSASRRFLSSLSSFRVGSRRIRRDFVR